MARGRRRAGRPPRLAGDEVLAVLLLVGSIASAAAAVAVIWLLPT